MAVCVAGNNEGIPSLLSVLLLNIPLSPVHYSKVIPLLHPLITTTSPTSLPSLLSCSSFLTLIVSVFQVITKLYETLHKDTTPSHTMWMAACGGVAAAIVLKVVVAYQVIVASAFLVHFVLYYAALAMALFGVGLGVAGAVFFDKRTGRAATGFAEKTKTTVRRTAQQVSSEFGKSD
jgi:hypothetical protein